MANSRKTHSNTRKVIYIIPDRQLLGTAELLRPGIWKIGPKNFIYFQTFQLCEKEMCKK